VPLNKNAMSNLNIKVITGQTELAQDAREKIQPFLELPEVSETEHRQDADLRLVLGGDGTALQEARHSLEIPNNGLPPIFGIKAGNPRSKGMLLNDVLDLEPDALLEIIRTAIDQKFHYLQASILNGSDETQEILAFNDINTVREAAQSAAMRIILNNETIAERAMGDGMLVCTPQGSTAYNLAAGGKVATAMSTLQITGLISSVSSLVVPDNSHIRFEILEPEKRPQRAETDGRIISRDVRSLEISKSELHSVLKFIKELPFRRKMIQEALRSN
jgi:NAD+ kinase